VCKVQETSGFNQRHDKHMKKSFCKK